MITSSLLSSALRSACLCLCVPSCPLNSGIIRDSHTSVSILPLGLSFPPLLSPSLFQFFTAGAHVSRGVLELTMGERKLLIRCLYLPSAGMTGTNTPSLAFAGD